MEDYEMMEMGMAEVARRLHVVTVQRNELLEALEEVIAVFDSNPSSITDTVWVTGNRPETLYDCCRAAIAKAKGEK